MGKLGKETKTLLIAITAVCLISFLLAGGIATLLAKNFQQELLLHDYGVAGHLLNNENELALQNKEKITNKSTLYRNKFIPTFIFVDTVNHCYLSKSFFCGHSNLL